MATELTEAHLNQCINQIKHVPAFDNGAENLSAFIKRIDFILSLYPTTDVRQSSVIFGAIERQLDGEALRTSQITQSNNWMSLRSSLIEEFRTQTPYEELLRRLYNTNWNGSLRKFVEELERKSYIVSNKLALDTDGNTAIIYRNALKITTKNVITRKLPDRIYMTLARHDITSISKLKAVAQTEGIYESYETQNNHKSENNSRRNQNKSYANYSNNSHSDESSNSKPQINYSNSNQNNQNLHQEFNKKLKETQTQNPYNYSRDTSTSRGPNPPVKRQRESQSGQFKMEQGENFHQSASELNAEQTHHT